jgi:hypothetical protein
MNIGVATWHGHQLIKSSPFPGKRATSGDAIADVGASPLIRLALPAIQRPAHAVKVPLVFNTLRKGTRAVSRALDPV